jgi:hypothetical protein
MKKVIRINETELKNIIKESINSILNEANLIQRVKDEDYPAEQIDLDDLSNLKNNKYSAYKALAQRLDKPLDPKKTKKLQCFYSKMHILTVNTQRIIDFFIKNK